MKDSDSYVQRDIEKIVLRKLGLEPAIIKIKDVKFSFDGFSDDKNEIVEIYAGIKTIKSAQRQKISQDILKMLLFEKLKGCVYRKSFVVIDKELYRKLQFEESKSWKNLAFKEFGINVEYVEIAENDYKRIINAKKKQGEKFMN